MFASILINTNAKELNRVFDYVVPKEYENVISVGARVFVPFGKGKNLSEGYIVDLMDSSEFANKEIASIEDSILTEDNVELAKLMAQKYFCNVEDSINILEGIKKYYEDYHKVRISTDVIRKTVIMSEKYIHDRFLPDKAIDILDEACSRKNLDNVELFKLEVLKN